MVCNTDIFQKQSSSQSIFCSKPESQLATMFNKIKPVSITIHLPISTIQKKMLIILGTDEIRKLGNAPLTIKTIKLVGNEIEINVPISADAKHMNLILLQINSWIHKYKYQFESFA
jgi:hypothetical protein